MISDDYQDYTLSCPAGIGTISADGKAPYTAEEGGAGGGRHGQRWHCQGLDTGVVVTTVIPSVRLERVILDGVKDYTAEISATTGSTTFFSAPRPSIESSDTDGNRERRRCVVKGVATGTATITAKRGEATVSFTADRAAAEARRNQPMAEDGELEDTPFGRENCHHDGFGKRRSHRLPRCRVLSAHRKSRFRPTPEL